MGVIYKLKPNVKEYILEAKRNNPGLSCRKVSSLILDKYQIKLSKSSINALFKEAGLSMPVGRRRKKKRGFIEMQGLGAILLKAADYLVGGSYHIAQAIKARLKTEEKALLEKTESLIYLPLFSSGDVKTHPDLSLEYLVGKKILPQDLVSYREALKEAGPLAVDISKIIPSLFQEVRCIKINLDTPTELFLDGQFHTVWSTPHTPYDFSTPVHSVKNYLSRYFRQDTPLVLFTAPGYDMPTREFFTFISNMNYLENKIAYFTLYGNKLEEIERISLETTKRRFFIFGLWPWQFISHRQVKKLGKFRPFCYEALKEKFYLSDIELELFPSGSDKGFSLNGCALKTDPQGKIRLVILSNLSLSESKAEELANAYLDHWPNLEESFEDFSRKIELFTYTASSQRYCTQEKLSFDTGASQDIKAPLESYLKALDLCVRWHILPSGYEDKDFAVTNERFYNLAAKIKKEKGRIYFNFQVPAGYSFLKDLEYACRRINERETLVAEGLRLWCKIVK